MALLILAAACKFTAAGQAAEGPSGVPSPTTPPSTPTPTPTPTPAPSLSLLGAAPIDSNFDINLTLQPAGGTGAIPPSGAPDVVGAFRFICGPGQLLYDDPIVFPGQPGKSHLHQFYGNTAANASSTYQSLRASGDSTCNFTGLGVAANRSGYWQPAMLDGKGHVVQPDNVNIYYKRRPASDPIVSDPTNPQYEGKALPLPNGLRFVFGWDPTGQNSAPTGAGYFNCDGPTARPGHYLTIPEAAANCPAGQGNRLGFVINAPACWDGKNLDSPDHRSHVGYPGYGGWGYLKCDDAHPYVIPSFTLGSWYSVEAGDDPNLWSLSSDMMAPDKPHGSTIHADWFGAWDNNVMSMWMDNCINKLLNCSAGDLGNGKQLKGAAQPQYDGVLSWKAIPHLVPVP